MSHLRKFVPTGMVMFLVLTMLGGCFSPTKPYVSLKSKNGNQDFHVEIADTRDERTKGLMFRESLAERDGMLFIFEDNSEKTFWMKNTFLPLDIVFMNENKEIVHILRNAEPCTEDICPKFSSQLPSRYVLEINAGMSDKLGILEGDKAEFNL